MSSIIFKICKNFLIFTFIFIIFVLFLWVDQHFCLVLYTFCLKDFFKTFFCITNLLSMNCLSFYLFENYFTLTIEKYFHWVYRVPSPNPFLVLQRYSSIVLACMVVGKKSAVFLLFQI